MPIKDWTFDISKLAAGKPLTPVSFGGVPKNTYNPPQMPGQTQTPTQPYDPFGMFNRKPEGGGSSTFIPQTGVTLPTTQGAVNPFKPAPAPTGFSPLPSVAPSNKSLEEKMTPPLPTNTNILTPTSPTLGKGAMPATTTPAAPPTNTNIATPVSPALAKGAMPATTPAPAAPKNTDVATAAPAALAKGAVNTKTGEAAKPGATTQPTVPVSPFQDAYTKALAELKAIVSQEDPRYKAAVNQFITNSSLMDQADRDMLQMQINQDPSLRGQGAGFAMLQVLNRDQRFNLDQGLAQLSNANLERIVNLQKYGLETGLKITEAYNAQKKEAFNTLLTNGQFGAAASTLQSMFDEQFPGLGLKVDAETLKSRDPYTLNQMATKLDFVKSLASSKPTAALPIVQSMLQDPQFKDYFPEGMTAEQVIQSFVTGEIPANLTQAKTVQQTINEIAAAGQSFEETGNSYPELFRLMGRNGAQEGRNLTAEQVNALRASQGLPAFQVGAGGALVDSDVTPLDDKDYEDLAYRKDYQDRITKAQEKPWEAVYKQLLGTPGLGEKLLKPELYPGANDAVKKVLAGISLGTDLFYKDPATGLWSLDMNKANLSESNPELQPYFMNWPTAAFNADGTVAAYTPGGYVYGEVVNGKPITSTREDEALDQAYFAYRRTTGADALNPTEWYFATAKGTRQPDATKIPEQFKPKGDDFQNVGVVKVDGPGTGVSTEPPKPGTLGAVSAAQDSVDEIVKTLPATSTATAESIKKEVANLSASNYRDVDAYRALEKLNMSGFKSNASFSTSSLTSPWKVTPEGKIYFGFYNLMQSGMNEKQAAGLAIQAVGEAKFKAAYKALTGKDWV